jgi:tRNA(fMet)-specific endonuclease VapC
MADRCLLDTGVANLAALNDAAMIQRLALADVVYIPSIVFGELYYGAYWYAHLHQSTKLLDLYDAFLQQWSKNIIHCNTSTTTIYGTIYAELRSKGQLIQQNDVWIAALAKQYNLALLTQDKDHQRVTGLALELW